MINIYNIKKRLINLLPGCFLSQSYPPEKKRGFEIVSLIMSFMAVWISWNGQDYIKATYTNNQKIIIYSEKNKEQESGNKIHPIGENKKILSVDVFYPKGFTKKNDYIDSLGVYENDPQLFNRISEIIPKGIRDGDYSASIPVQLLIRYAADGDAYVDKSIYIMRFYFHLSHKPETDSYLLIPIETHLIFASRTPTSLIYKVACLFGYDDETQDIDKMFEKKKYWNSVNLAGRF